MGMDVYGIGNADAYFRANIWSWKPIHGLIKKLASDLVDEETMHGMAFNSGYGIKDGDKCRTLANRISCWMEHNVDGVTDEHGSEEESAINEMIDSIGSMLGTDVVQVKFGESNDKPIFKVDDEHLSEFVAFLRTCGGFKVL